MEIKSLKVVGSTLYFRFVCGKCKNEVDSEANFCSKCGSKLEKINRSLPLKSAISILTAVLQNKPVPPINKEADEKDGQEVTTATGIIDGSFPSGRPQVTTCPRCKVSKKGCEFYSREDGLCYGIVNPTYPPQYPKCVFTKE